MRTMTRAVRRAAIPLWYTEGFNRHPYLTFAAPLSLGYEGLRETMDIRLEKDMDYGLLAQRLSDALPEGIRAVSAAEAVDKVKELTAAVYQITFACSADVVSNMLSQPEILVEKRTKKKTMKTIDIRPYFEKAAVEAAGENQCTMTVTLPCGSDENINPGLFLAALNTAQDQEIDAKFLRLRLEKADGTEFL